MSSIKKFRILKFKKFKPFLSLKNITKSYGKRLVLKGLSFNVNHAEIKGILGPNGSGKTTIFQTIMGIIKADSGQVKIENEIVNTLPIHVRALKHRVGYVPQVGGFLHGVSVSDNCEAFGEVHIKDPIERNDKVQRIISEFNLDSISSLKARDISGGEKRRLAIAIAMINEPKIILLDEPFAALDIQTIDMIKMLILKLQKLNIACVITDHQAASILEVSDSALILANGIIVADSSPKDLVNNEKAKQIYFGQHFSLN